MHVWRETDGVTQLQLKRFAAAVDPLRPAGGLQHAVVDGSPLAEFHPLGLELDDALDARVEHYVRSGDLIAAYADRPAPAMRTEAYWRSRVHAADSAIAAIELVPSVQTDLLDSHPLLATHSELVACEAFQLIDPTQGTFAGLVPPQADQQPDDVADAPHCYLFRLPGRRYSYAEMVYPSDIHRSHWDGWLHGTDYRMRLRHELFPERLEKGVILRARVLGLLLDGPDDKAATARHWRAFLEEELPLAT